MSASDPLALLGEWLPGREDERPVMTLSSVDAKGYPNSRSVLLSAFDSTALMFHTDIRSRKVADLATNPKVSIVLAWPENARQVTLQGDAELMTREQAADDYTAIPRYLQLLAWLNTPRIAVLPTDERRARWAEFSAAHPEGTLTAPPTWTGYRVIPRRITFWRGDMEGPSNRIEYERDGTGWAVQILPG